MSIPTHQNPSREHQARAPYNFVPVPEVVVPAQDLPERDRYYANRHTGRIHCTLTTQTPLYTRAALEADDEYREVKDKPDFFYVDPATKRPVIPGSSLRGVLRSLVEIVSYSKLQPVTHQWLFFRTMDGSRVMTAYGNRVGLNPQDNKIRGGIFHTDGEHHSIQPCLVARVPYEEGSDYKISGHYVWTGKKPNLSPDWQLQHTSIWVKPAEGATKDLFHFRFAEGVESSQPNKTGYFSATLVITGWAPERKIWENGQVIRVDKKKGEFAFIQTREKRIPVDDKFVRDFETEGQISQWQANAFPLDEPDGAHRKLPGGLRDGEPVFYMKQDDDKVILGRAGKFRLPYKNTPREMLPDWGAEHGMPTPNLVDIAEAIFGRVDEQAQLQPQLAGRVYVGDAHVPGERAFTEWVELPPNDRLKILNSPKSTAVQHYLTQDAPNDIKTLRHYDDSSAETTLRGHKLYWHKNGKLKKEDWAEVPVPAKKNLYTGPVRPVAPGVTFEFDLWFENLGGEELGALLWVLRLASHEHYRIKLGLGKPYGLGTVRVSYELETDDRKNRYQTLGDAGGWMQPSQAHDEEALLRLFEQRILCYLGDRRKDARCLSHVPRIRQLLSMLTWEGPNPQQTAYMELEEFRKRKVLPKPTSLTPGGGTPILEPISRDAMLADLPWRIGEVRKSPSQGRGTLRDRDKEYSFRKKDVITQGYTPGKRHQVWYKAGEDIDCSRIILIKKK